jgi:hypothetical protein
MPTAVEVTDWRSMANGLAGRAVFADTWQSYAVILIWAAAMYGLLRWRLSRRES